MNLEQREKEEKRRRTWMRQPNEKSARLDTTPGKASDYIHWLKDWVKAHPLVTAVVLYLRVSGRTQKWTNNLRVQEDWCIAQLRILGVTVIAVFREVGSGYADARLTYAAAVDCAREHGVPLVALCTDRLLRSEDFSTKSNRYVQPSVAEYERLTAIARGVTLATILDPDMPWDRPDSEDGETTHQYQTKLGQAVKSKGGRPKKNRTESGAKKAIRERQQPKLRWLLRVGYSERQIVAALHVPRRTIRRWVAKLSQ
jgi:hypothetical protein